jgi:hypothetical protein
MQEFVRACTLATRSRAATRSPAVIQEPRPRLRGEPKRVGARSVFTRLAAATRLTRSQ